VSAVTIAHPSWVATAVDWDRRYSSDEERMRLAVSLARRNVGERTGGPFGAAVFERESGRLVSVGTNSVVRANNCVLHGEVVAIMMAQERLSSYTLRADAMPEHELVTSCEPCAMCLGATLWSGVRRLVCGAVRDDAGRLGFEEGPVFPQSHAYLTERGIEIVLGVCRAEANEVMEMYVREGGKIYNG
jgi:tRNA(Arg) A34 adenosine deaminase TadA